MLERFAILNKLESREFELGQGTPSEYRRFERSFWTIVFGNMYWNRRYVVPHAANQQAMNDFEAEDEEEENEEQVFDVTDVLEPIERKVITRRQMDVVHDIVDEDADEAIDVGGVMLNDRLVNQQGLYRYEEEVKPVLDFDGEPLRKIKRKMKRRYETILLYKLREKFRWATTPRNALNDTAIHNYAVALMVRDHLRSVDRHRILTTIVDRYYTPLRSDMSSVNYSNSVVVSSLRKRVNGTYVEANFQRFLGLGIAPNPRPQVQ
jgi:hypothetical protein